MIDDRERALWLAERQGKLTASRMADVLAVLKNGKPAKARLDYAMELVAERVADGTMRHYVSPAMMHGLEYEEEARRAYEAATGDLIDDPRTGAPLGIFNHPTIPFFAASPDGLLGRDGLIETKCPTTRTFVEWKMAGVVPEEHEPQMLAQLACTGRRFVIFAAYDPRIKDPDARLFVRRFEPQRERIAQTEDAARAFLAEVEAMFQAFTERAA